MKHHVYFSSSVHLPAPPSNSVSAGVDHVSPLPPFPFTPNWASHNCGIGPDYIDLRLFHLTHLLAGLSTHHWMLNSIKGNATVIKGLVSQLLLAQAPHALNWNRWRTSGARLNTHSESPKAGRVFFFVFHIFSLCMSQGHGNPLPERLLILSTVPPEPLPLFNIEHTWTNTGAAVFHYVKCRCDGEILLLWTWLWGWKTALWKQFWGAHRT